MGWSDGRIARWPQTTAPKASVMPAICTGVSAWPSAAQPTAVATSGESNPSREAFAAGSRSRPQNQMVYASSVPTTDR